MVGAANAGDLVGLPDGVSELAGVYSPAVCHRRWLALLVISLPMCSAFGITCRRIFLRAWARLAVPCPCPTIIGICFYTVM